VKHHRDELPSEVQARLIVEQALKQAVPDDKLRGILTVNFDFKIEEASQRSRSHKGQHSPYTIDVPELYASHNMRLGFFLEIVLAIGALIAAVPIAIAVWPNHGPTHSWLFFAAPVLGGAIALVLGREVSQWHAATRTARARSTALALSVGALTSMQKTLIEQLERSPDEDE
jgi:hypothetical protein